MGTVTVLFTDIEGSTKLTQRVGERYGEIRADHTLLAGRPGEVQGALT